MSRKIEADTISKPPTLLSTLDKPTYNRTLSRIVSTAKELQSAQPVDQVLLLTEVSVSVSVVPASPQTIFCFIERWVAIRGRVSM